MEAAGLDSPIMISEETFTLISAQFSLSFCIEVLKRCDPIT